MVGAAVRKPRVPNDKLHRVTDNSLAEVDRKVLHGCAGGAGWQDMDQLSICTIYY